MKSVKASSFLLVFLLTISLVLTGCKTLPDARDTQGAGTDIPNSVSESIPSQASADSTETEPITQAPVTEAPETKPVTQAPVTEAPETKPVTQAQLSEPSFELAIIPSFGQSPYVAIHENKPYFTGSDLQATSFEAYASLDNLGRCGAAYACIGLDIMPTEERGSIGSVQPSGWHTVKYECVDGNYLYNRCHLIGYQLSGENANNKNLITGTRYLNVEGMLPFENMIADYVKETGNHVLYRVTPIFDGNNLVASGVLMEAESVEDRGEGILFCVYCYNNQPGITIDYATGESRFSETAPVVETTNTADTEKAEEIHAAQTYILNTNTKKFHYPSCGSAKKISDKNRQTYSGSREDLISRGYDPCGNCDP